MGIKKYIKNIVDNGKQEDMEKLSDMLEETILKLKIYDEKCYEKYKLKLYELAFGKKLTDEMAEEWVNNMNPIGLHWTKEETTIAMRNMGYNLNDTDFFVVANMMYNDYNNLVNDNEQLALKLAKDWLEDTDAVEGKLYEYWKYIAK